MNDNYVVTVYEKLENQKEDEIPTKPVDIKFVNGLEELLDTTHKLSKDKREYKVFELGKCLADTCGFWEKEGEQWVEKNMHAGNVQ